MAVGTLLNGEGRVEEALLGRSPRGTRLAFVESIALEFVLAVRRNNVAVRFGGTPLEPESSNKLYRNVFIRLFCMHRPAELVRSWHVLSGFVGAPTNSFDD